jgi:hypothetical protein
MYVKKNSYNLTSVFLFLQMSTANLSAYEIARLENIARNTAELRRLGLHVNRLTRPAQGAQKPSAATRAKRAVPPRSRWSSRLVGKPEVNYKEDSSSSAASSSSSPRKKQRKSNSSSSSANVLPRNSLSNKTIAGGHQIEPLPARSTNPRSIKNLCVDLKHLNTNFLGQIIPPLGGQVKRAAMLECAPKSSPTFSRMSGIQEWKNAVCLFVNVYGDGYKNVFLEGGRFITWFAQNRQWEGTPVVQRLINCAGGKNAEGSTVKATPVLLFCRNKGQGYVYCGRLGYSGHDPDRIPVRFVWELLDHETMVRGEPFQNLVVACNELLNYRSTPLSAAVPDPEFMSEKKAGTKLLKKRRR